MRCPTAATILGRVRRVDRFHSLPGACCLESEDGQEVAPPGVVDALVEAGLAAGPVVEHSRRSHPAWARDGGSSWRAGLPRHRSCRTRAPGQAPSCGGSRALPPDVLMRLGTPAHGLAAALAALLPAGDPPLRLLQRALGLAVVARILDDLALRRDEEHLQPHIDAGLVAGAGAAARPAPRHRRSRRTSHPPRGDRDGLERALDGPGPAHRDAPDLRQDQIAVIQPGAVAVLLVGEGVASGCAPGSGGSPASRRSPRGGRRPDTSCPAGPARPAGRGCGWRRTPGTPRGCPSTPLPAGSA